MKIGILGPEHMAMTWEKHLRSVSDVHEVVIAPKLRLLRNLDACLILSNTTLHSESTEYVLEALKHGYHILWIAPPPLKTVDVNRWYEASEEAGVTVMFAMWPHYSPATRWLCNHITNPEKIIIHREWPGPKFTPDPHALHRIILEELSLCLEWAQKRVVKLEGDLDLSQSHNNPASATKQLHIQFAGKTSASIHLIPYGLENRHSRFVTGEHMAAVCQINDQMIKKWLFHGKESHTPELMHFDYREPARLLISHFIRSIRTEGKPLYGIVELQKLVSFLDRFSDTNQ